jgi:hypothetical protein
MAGKISRWPMICFLTTDLVKAGQNRSVMRRASGGVAWILNDAQLLEWKIAAAPSFEPSFLLLSYYSRSWIRLYPADLCSPIQRVTRSQF